MGDGRPAVAMQAAAASAAAAMAASAERGAASRAGSVAEDPAHPAGAARRLVPPCGRRRPRPGRARPSRRADRRLNDRRAARRRRLWPSLPRSWRSALQRVAITRELSPSDIDALRVISRQIALPRPTCCTATAPRAPPWRGSRFSAPNAIRVYTPHGGSLVYRPGTLSRRLLPHAGMAAEMAHRSFSVREQLCRRPVPRRDRPAAGDGAHRAQRRQRRRIRADHGARPMPPISSVSANCGRSRRSTS